MVMEFKHTADYADVEALAIMVSGRRGPSLGRGTSQGMGSWAN